MGSQLHAPSALTQGKNLVPIAQEAVAAPGPVWRGTVNLVPTGVRTEDRPARTESLHRLSYPGSDSPRYDVLFFPVLLTYAKKQRKVGNLSIILSLT